GASRKLSAAEPVSRDIPDSGLCWTRRDDSFLEATMATDGVFISYRREETAGFAGRLYDRLVSRFGRERIFMDVEGIDPGVDFVEAIERAVASCRALVVVIGPGWSSVADKNGNRRLDDPQDFVRLETAAALRRSIRVLPVLVNDANMPREEDLPE
ncbi:toll/interleukin-1 receptor domain-containing protein, partial [Arthrospira platensis SPKY1]|nr:toll/interleukin-1 receptor domain-containing protein [Arthrospira platensis SPKY1]